MALVSEASNESLPPCVTDLSKDFDSLLSEHLEALRVLLVSKHDQDLRSLNPPSPHSPQRRATSEIVNQQSRDTFDVDTECSNDRVESKISTGRSRFLRSTRASKRALSFEIDPLFSIDPDDGGFAKHRPPVRGSSRSKLFDTAVIHAGDELHNDNRCLRGMVSHPLTKRRLLLDVAGMLIILYDVVLSPLTLVNLIESGNVMRLLGLVVTCWWTLDLLANFCRGYEEGGAVEMRLQRIACRYLRTWFAVDCTLVVLDWIMVVLESLTSFWSVARTARLARVSVIFRMLRLIRAFKLHKLTGNVRSTVREADTPTALLPVLSWIVGILVLNHVIACFWLLLGQIITDIPSWLDQVKFDYNAFSKGEPSDWYYYATALHWALTQFTPASMEVVPANTYERFFTICTMFFALVLFSSFLASITNAVADFRRKTAEFTKARDALDRFLQENRIPLDLGSRVQTVVSEQYKQMTRARRLHEADVWLLKLLPRSIIEQLRGEVYRETIITHPFIEVMSMYDESILIKLCDRAMSQHSLMPGQDLFIYGKEAHHLYFVVTGKLSYFEGSVASLHASAEVCSGEWMCQQVLFMKWEHCGRTTALNPCELALLDAAKFREVVKKNPRILAFCIRLAMVYVQSLEDSFGKVTDVSGGSRDSLRDIVSEVVGSNISLFEADDDELVMQTSRPSVI